MAAIAGSPGRWVSCHVTDEENETQGGQSNCKVAQLVSKGEGCLSIGLVSEVPAVTTVYDSLSIRTTNLGKRLPSAKHRSV